MASLASKFSPPFLAHLKKLRDKGAHGYIEDELDQGPPSVRFLDISYVPLFRQEGNNKIFVGSFAPELYNLANTNPGMLKQQVLAREWAKAHFGDNPPKMDSLEFKNALNPNTNPTFRTVYPTYRKVYSTLYRPNGTLKTPFELALIPSKDRMDVQIHYDNEYKFQRDRQHALPAMVSKFRANVDYLENCRKAGLVAGIEAGERENAYGLKLNLKNPSEKRTRREKILHYVGSWAASLSTLMSALAISLIPIARGWSRLNMFGLFSLAYLGKKCLDMFAKFDFAEELHRVSGAMLNRQLSRTGKFSLERTLESALYASAALLLGGLAAHQIWSEVLELPWMVLASKWGASSALVSAAQMSTAGFLAATGGLALFLGSCFAIRYFWGLTIWNTQIDFDNAQMKDIVKNLPELLTRRQVRERAHAAQKEMDPLVRRSESTYVPTLKATLQQGKELGVEHQGNTPNILSSEKRAKIRAVA